MSCCNAAVLSRRRIIVEQKWAVMVVFSGSNIRANLKPVRGLVLVRPRLTISPTWNMLRSDWKGAGF